jgi:hypothetical protein
MPSWTTILGRARRLANFRLSILVAVVVAACGEEVPTNVAQDCDNPVLTVTAGSIPEISWEPACFVSIVVVDQDGTRETEGRRRPAWVIASGGQVNRVEPPIRYGRVPENGIQLVPPAALTSGETYRVEITWFDSSGDLQDESIALQP